MYFVENIVIIVISATSGEQCHILCGTFNIIVFDKNLMVCEVNKWKYIHTFDITSKIYTYDFHEVFTFGMSFFDVFSRLITEFEFDLNNIPFILTLTNNRR